eukprot:27188-Prymnesium_polylepis.1
MAQEMKLLLQMIRKVSYAGIVGRLAREQAGSRMAGRFRRNGSCTRCCTGGSIGSQAGTSAVAT